MAKKKLNLVKSSSLIRRAWRFIRRWVLRLILLLTVIFALWIVAYKYLTPWTTIYMMQENWRQDGVQYEWVDMDQIAPVMQRAVVAAEDANYCLHWGLDSAAIQMALQEGAVRGGSTISQQTVKNAFLWQGRNWVRKGLEAALTPIADWVWGKERMLEIYLNIIEFDTGVFGIQAAAQHHFGVDAKDLNRVQAGRLAAVLPNPKDYSAVRPSAFMQKRARSIIAGSDIIRRDGRANCFQS
ncbi:MAG: monofunctional biosynthetic peptidoglycan transglycosylase [Planktomarina sp.]